MPNDYLIAAGEVLGYQKCCIDAYLKIDKVDTAPELQKTAWAISGQYFPCEKHAHQILNGEITVFDLIHNRHRDLPAFSLELKYEETDELVKALLKKLDPIKWAGI